MRSAVGREVGLALLGERLCPLHTLVAGDEHLEAVEGDVGYASDVLSVCVEGVLEELQCGRRVGRDLAGVLPGPVKQLRGWDDVVDEVPALGGLCVDEIQQE